jgi:hypothetical protein
MQMANSDNSATLHQAPAALPRDTVGLEVDALAF